MKLGKLRVGMADYKMAFAVSWNNKVILWLPFHSWKYKIKEFFSKRSIILEVNGVKCKVSKKEARKIEGMQKYI